MRILWFTNVPMPAVHRRLGRPMTGTGAWMTELLEELRNQVGVQLAVATAFPRLPALYFEERGVRYFTVGQPALTSQISAQRRQDLAACREVVRTFRPDVIHVHGTERFYGLLAARHLVEAPVVISMQGFISEYVKLFFGVLSWRDVLRSQRLVEVLTRRGLLWGYLDFLRAAAREEEILRSGATFTGRTRWDHDKLQSLDPGARYFHVGEVLRPEFSIEAWALEGCRRESIFITNVGDPRRGLETLLSAAAILRARRPGLELRLAGSVRDDTGYGRFVKGRVRELGLSDRVKFLGFLDGPSLVRGLLTSQAYVIASVSENSPNSLCEAMRLGLPCVASAAGGIPSLVLDGVTGLLFPPGDAPGLARRLDEVLADDVLATRLASAARAEAARRHDPETVVAQLLAAYRGATGTSHRAQRSA